MSEDLKKNRLLLEISNRIRHLNREIINPKIPELTIDGLLPVMSLVARVRALYLTEVFDVAAIAGDDGLPTVDQINKLRNLRHIYEELVSGAQAVETAIERGYLDVTGELK